MSQYCFSVTNFSAGSWEKPFSTILSYKREKCFYFIYFFFLFYKWQWTLPRPCFLAMVAKRCHFWHVAKLWELFCGYTHIRYHKLYPAWDCMNKYDGQIQNIYWILSSHLQNIRIGSIISQGCLLMCRYCRLEKHLWRWSA